MLPTVSHARALGYDCEKRSAFPLPRRQQRWLTTTLLVAVAFALVWTTTRSSPTKKLARQGYVSDTLMRIETPHSHLDACTLDMSRMRSFNLTSRFHYAQRHARSVPLSSARHGELQDGSNLEEVIQGQLFPAGDLITNGGDTTIALQDCSTDVVPMMLRHEDWLDTTDNAAADDFGNLMFGVASTSERLLEAKEHFGFWLGHTGARLLVAVPDSPFVPLLEWELQKRGVNVDIIVTAPEAEFLDTYFNLALWLNERKTADTEWLTFIDDDTFYFSLRRFATLLRKYDPSDDVYVGAPSEDSWQMMRSGVFAFGGAGITLSGPLLEKVVAVHDVCKTYTKLEPNDPEMGGDLRLARCITRNTRAKLSIEADLHQVDLRGDQRGVLQGPRVPVNWHHYHSRMWGGMDVLRYANSTPFCDGDCLFQRWKFYGGQADDDVSTLHLGHSFVRYAPHIDPELAWYELTWTRKPLSVYDHSFEPLRRTYEEGKERFTHLFEAGHWRVDGSFVQTYIKRAGALSGDVDSVVELIWR